MNIIVCVKIVPKPEEVTVDEKTFTLDRTKARSEINPSDMNAIEIALQLKERHGGKVTVLSMGPPFFDKYLRVVLAMGADEAVLLSDKAFAGADTLATSYTLAKGIEKIGKQELVLCGEESSDGSTAQVPPGIAEWLNVSQVTYALDIEMSENKILKAKRLGNNGYEIIEVPLPAVVSVITASNEARFINYDRKNWADNEYKVTIWNANDINADPSCIGFPGSPTSVAGLKTLKPPERRKEQIKGTPEEKARTLAKIIQAALAK